MNDMPRKIGFNDTKRRIKKLEDTIHTETNITFDSLDARFFSELGLPDVQSWATSPTLILVDDTIFGVEKEIIRFIGTGHPSADRLLTSESWSDILIFGASYSSVIKYSGFSIPSVFSGLGFSSDNDPRASSIQSRIGFFIGKSGIYTTVTIEGGANGGIALDGTGGKPLVLLDTWFAFEMRIHKSPDEGTCSDNLYSDQFTCEASLNTWTPNVGVNFGAVDLYINEVLLDIGSLALSNNAVNNVISISGASNTYVDYSIDNFGVTIYKESPEKTLIDVDMAHDVINIITPGGNRDYVTTLQDDNPRKIGNSIKLTARNVGGSVTFRTEDFNSPQSLFNGYNSYSIPIKLKSETVLTNLVDNGNIYQAIIPFDDGEGLRTGMIAYNGMSLHQDTLTVTFSERVMRFVDKIKHTSVIVTKPATDFLFTNGLTAPDDLGVVHFYEDIEGNIFGSAKTDWSTPEQRRRYAYLGNADVNLTKDDFLQANNPLISAFGAVDTLFDILAIGGSIKGKGGIVSSPMTTTDFLGLNITGYTAVALGRNFGNKELPHTPTSDLITDAVLHLGYKTTAISMLFGPPTPAIDPTKYQRIEDTILTPVPSGKYTIQRVYQYPGTDYNMVIFGSTLYDNLEQAKLSASTERYNLHPSLTPACFLAYIIVRNDVTNLMVSITAPEPTAAILNYDGHTHPQTIGAEASPTLALRAGGSLRTMVDQYADITTNADVYIDFEFTSLYGCIWNGTDKTLKNLSQKDMIVNLVAMVGRRSTSSSVDLEIFIDISYDDGVIWETSGGNTYAIFKSIENQFDSSAPMSLVFRVIPGAMIRIGIMISSSAAQVGIIAIGDGNIPPITSISNRAVPSCELTIT